MVVNRTRLILAVLLLTTTHLIIGLPIPFNAPAQRWFWLGISGIVGLVLGDAFLFQAFIFIGPRLSMLLMSLVPIIASLSAWLFLNETLSGVQILGILITLMGVAWVIWEGDGARNSQNRNSNYLQGILFGLGGATGQALGLIFAKKGLEGDFPALSATLMRMLVAAIVLWGFTLLRGQAGTTIAKLVSHHRASLLILGGSFTGPFLGVTFSLIAIQNTEIGIASTLMALTPVFLLPIGYFVFNERFGWQAIAGTLVAMIGALWELPWYPPYMGMGKIEGKNNKRGAKR
jgi:drug/metabolite transporter (DMT)-like permease